MNCLACHPAGAEEPKTDRYLGPVLGCLDTLIEDCTDTYGSEHSPMFCSLVDLKTHRIPKKAPPLLRQQRKSDRAYPGGNLQHDMFTLLAMYHVSTLTGDDFQGSDDHASGYKTGILIVADHTGTAYTEDSMLTTKRRTSP